MKATLYTFHLKGGDKVMIVRKTKAEAFMAVPESEQELIIKIDDDDVTLSRL